MPKRLCQIQLLNACSFSCISARVTRLMACSCHTSHINLGCLQQTRADWSSGRSTAPAADNARDGLGSYFHARSSMKTHLHTSWWGELLVRGSTPPKPGAGVVQDAYSGREDAGHHAECMYQHHPSWWDMGSSRGNWSARGLCSCWGWECRGEAWGISSPAGRLANPAVHVNEKYLTNWTKQGAEGQGAILPNGCSGVAAPVVPQCAVPGAFAYFMEKTHGPLAGLLLQSRRDTLGLCTQISFNAEGRNRESTNVISFEERG